MKNLRTEILTLALVAVALVLLLPQVDLPDAVSVNRNAATLVGKSLAPNGPVSARIVSLHHQSPLHAFASEISLVGMVALHSHAAPALDLLCTLRC
jgi:hypothetical protein